MRYVYIGLIVIFTGLVLLFKFQNLETATITLFSASITLRLSVLVFLIYVLGMLTGGVPDDAGAVVGRRRQGRSLTNVLLPREVPPGSLRGSTSHARARRAA